MSERTAIRMERENTRCREQDRPGAGFQPSWVPLVAAYRRTPDSLLAESITRLALNVVLDFSLKHGPEFALFPPSDDAIANA